VAEGSRKVQCPACAHEFELRSGADLLRLVCPHCEAPIPESALKDKSELAEEIAPGFRPGQRLGNYVIESLLGAGGMAVVFKGKQLSLNRHVAVKILPKDFAKNKLFVERFEGEAAVLASLNHANIVNVIDRGREGETYFIVMEYVEGETLKDRLQRQTRLPPEEIIPIAQQFLAGMDYAHKRGVVHRDIKPGNIMINQEGIVKIADFGLAHLAKQHGGMDITRDNQSMGTLKYMAPEQLVSAKQVDSRADLYSFGICLYEMLTGSLPLGMFKMPSECDSNLDVRWDEIILRVLKMDMEERYPSAEEMLRDVRQLATTPRVTQSDRERQEEADAAKARAQAPASLSVACAQCGFENPPEAENCRCGVPLNDLFDRCPSCRNKNRIDVAACRSCGEDLGAYRVKVRRAAEQIQVRAKQYLEERQFDAAIEELGKLLKFKTREYATIRENAQLWLERTKSRKERFLQRTYEAGLRLIAEGRYDLALQMLQSLPEEYKDVAERRKEATAKRDEALAAKVEGSRLYKGGDPAGAVAAWEKAVQYLPQDTQLRESLARARIALGNLNIKRTYLKESQEAAERGNLTEAVALCRKALEIAPKDSTALALLNRYESRERSQVESATAEQPEIVLPRAQREPQRKEKFPWWKVIAALLIAGVVLVGLIVAAIAIPAARERNAAEAAMLLDEAKSLHEQGKIEEADAALSSLLNRYASTPSAAAASELRRTITETMTAARGACMAADELAKKEDPVSLKATYREYQRLMAGPPVSIVKTYNDYARARMEEMRAKLARHYVESATAQEKESRWREALAFYKEASADYGISSEPIASGLLQAQKKVEEFNRLARLSQEASTAGRWAEALQSAGGALEIIPADMTVQNLLTTAAKNAPPVEGMVLVLPGTYKVGGATSNPARTATLSCGLYVDRAEVTRGQYAEFVNATGLPIPPGWGADGTPPAGTESLPMAGVTIKDAAAFAQWAGKRLPTEEEWECAARGAEGLKYPWGDDWKPGAAILSFGPAPAGTAPGDKSPCGAMAMLGNVAEWTSTSATPAGCVVKGSSWAGIEKGRIAFVVAAPQGSGAAMLTAEPSAPVQYVRFPSSLEIIYLGTPIPDSARVSVKRWLQECQEWVEWRAQVPVNALLGGPQAVSVEDAVSHQKRSVQMDLSTGCTLLRFEAKWMEFRDPAGVVRRIDIAANTPTQSNRVVEKADAAPPTELTIEATAAGDARMIGQPGQGYINVGFRCVKPVWEPKPKAPPPATPGK